MKIGNLDISLKERENMKVSKIILKNILIIFVVLNMNQFINAAPIDGLYDLYSWVDNDVIADKININRTKTISCDYSDLMTDYEMVYEAYYLKMKNTKKVCITSTVGANVQGVSYLQAELHLYKIDNKNYITKKIGSIETEDSSSACYKGWLEAGGRYVLVVGNYIDESNCEYEYEDLSAKDVEYKRKISIQDITYESDLGINKTKLNLQRLDRIQLNVAGTSSKIRWSSTNKKVVSVDKKGNVVAKKAGKATVIAKVDGKLYKCIVTVKEIPVSFLAEVKKYDTRNNCFQLIIENFTKSKIRVFSDGAYSQDKDYSSYDRQLHLADNKEYIDVKPGKKTSIRFNIQGAPTWFDVSDHTLYFRFEFEGRKYWAKVSGLSCKYSSDKGKWKYTEEYAR